MRNFLAFIIVVILTLYEIYVFGRSNCLDSTFGTNGIVTTPIRYPGDDHGNSVALQPDGKIVVAGYSSDSNYSYDFAAVRYNLDGSPDSSFGINGIVVTEFDGDEYYNSSSANSVVIQIDGKIVAAGTGIRDFALVRYNTDGSLDSTFGCNGKVITDFDSNIDQGNSVVIQADGKIIVAGCSMNSNELYFFAAARYNSDGSLDSSFGTNGKVITDVGNGNDFGNSAAIQSDGKIVVGGSSSGDFAAVRYNTDGSLDNNFGCNGKVITDFSGGIDQGNSVAIQADGKIIVAGTSSSDIALVRYGIDGSPDSSFGILGKTTTDISDSVDIGNSVAIQADGKIVVAGGSYYNLTFYPSEYYYFEVVRYNSNGSLDSSFGSTGKVITVIGDGGSTCNSVAIQPDGKIVVAGVAYFSSAIFGAEDEFAVVRYLPNFNIGTMDFSDMDCPVLVCPNPIVKDAILEYILITQSRNIKIVKT
ncbi:MAG: hypothetical protein HY738_08130 [Bacteroidia bacterium]|nr:hypothetical protein [Bacteroidia bacterium]